MGLNNLNPFQALIFGRVRHPLPRGDFDRSANQQELLRSILRKVRVHQSEPGFMERGLLASVKFMDTDLSPAELYRLAQAVTAIRPGRLHGLRGQRADRATRAGPAWCSRTWPRPGGWGTTPARTAPWTADVEQVAWCPR